MAERFKLNIDLKKEQEARAAADAEVQRIGEEMEEKITKAAGEAAEKVKMLTGAMQKMSKDLQHSQASLASTQAELVATQEKLAALQGAGNGELEQARRHVTELQAELEAATAASTAVREELAAKAKETAALTQRLNATAKERDAAVERADKLKGELAVGFEKHAKEARETSQRLQVELLIPSESPLSPSDFVGLLLTPPNSFRLLLTPSGSF